MMRGNMNNIVKQAQKMQTQMLRLQEELANRTVEATAGGGAVKVVISGGLEVKEIKIDPEAVDPNDISMLEDLILSAVNEGIKSAQAMTAEEMGKVTGNFNIPGLGNLF